MTTESSTETISAEITTQAVSNMTTESIIETAAEEITTEAIIDQTNESIIEILFTEAVRGVASVGQGLDQRAESFSEGTEQVSLQRSDGTKQRAQWKRAPGRTT